MQLCQSIKGVQQQPNSSPSVSNIKIQLWQSSSISDSLFNSHNGQSYSISPYFSHPGQPSFSNPDSFSHSHAGTVTYHLNQWITDPNDGQAQGYQHGAGYRTGFHISLSKRGLHGISPTVIKVRFRNVTATQIDKPDSTYGKQVVAREIMNLGEV